MKIDLIAGARPNFIKIAPIIDAIKVKQAKGADIHFRLVHTGQHYDQNLSGSFFEQLGIPEPDINLGAGSGTQAEQTAAIMIGYEKLLIEESTDLCNAPSSQCGRKKQIKGFPVRNYSPLPASPHCLPGPSESRHRHP